MSHLWPKKFSVLVVYVCFVSNCRQRYKSNFRPQRHIGFAIYVWFVCVDLHCIVRLINNEIHIYNWSTLVICCVSCPSVITLPIFMESLCFGTDVFGLILFHNLCSTHSCLIFVILFALFLHTWGCLRESGIFQTSQSLVPLVVFEIQTSGQEWVVTHTFLYKATLCSFGLNN